MIQDTVSRTINGAVVASYPKADPVGPGKLKSTEGVYGIRFAHNMEGNVSGLAVSKWHTAHRIRRLLRGSSLLIRGPT
jgi:hypothetical protein